MTQAQFSVQILYRDLRSKTLIFVTEQVFPISLTKKNCKSAALSYRFNEADCSLSYAMYMFGAINCVLMAYVWFMIHETKKVALKHMDAIFGGADHAERSAEVLVAQFDCMDPIVELVEDPAVQNSKKETSAV